jgi:hypothetical protein
MNLKDQMLKEIARLRAVSRKKRAALDENDTDEALQLFELDGYMSCLNELELFVRDLQ